MTISEGDQPTRVAGRLIATAGLAVILGLGCSAAPDQTSGPDDEASPALDGPPPVRLLAGAQPDGILIYESWVTDGEWHTSEPAAIPDDLIAVPWPQNEELTFEIGTDKGPRWLDVLVFEQLPDNRVPDTEPERIECLPSGAESRCRVDEGPDDSLSVTVSGSVASEIVILNVGWTRPAHPGAQDAPNLPPHDSASWVFAIEAAP